MKIDCFWCVRFDASVCDFLGIYVWRVPAPFDSC